MPPKKIVYMSGKIPQKARDVGVPKATQAAQIDRLAYAKRDATKPSQPATSPHKPQGAQSTQPPPQTEPKAEQEQKQKQKQTEPHDIDMSSDSEEDESEEEESLGVRVARRMEEMMRARGPYNPFVWDPQSGRYVSLLP